MAEHSLIDTYLDALRERLRWRANVDDVIAEAADHLYSAIDQPGDEDSEERALRRFGDPQIVATAFARSPHGGLALPTPATRSGGRFAIIAAIAWFFVPTSWWLAGVLEPWGDLDRNITALFWVIGWIALISAGALTVNTLTQLAARHGGLGRWGSAGIALCAAGVAVMTYSWIYGAWGLLTLGGTTIIGVAVLRRGTAPRLPAIGLALAMPAGALTWFATRLATNTLLADNVGIWDERWIANLASISIATVALGVALIGIGSWMKNEEPATGVLLEGVKAT